MDNREMVSVTYEMPVEVVQRWADTSVDIFGGHDDIVWRNRIQGCKAAMEEREQSERKDT